MCQIWSLQIQRFGLCVDCQSPISQFLLLYIQKKIQNKLTRLQGFGDLVQQAVEEGEAEGVVGGDGAEDGPLRQVVVELRQPALRRVLREDALRRRAEVAAPPVRSYLQTTFNCNF